MEKSLEEVAAFVGGRIKGEGNITIKGVASIKDAKPGEITFLSNPKYRRFIYETNASALITAEEVEGFKGSLLLHPNPYLAFAKLLGLFHEVREGEKGMSPLAFISPSALIGKGVSIYPFVYVGEGARIGEGVRLYPGVFVGDRVTIGDYSLIYSNVSIREDCVIGKRVIIHCGAVIGSDGFGYAREGDGYFKIPQVGNVVIEDDVEIGANVTIDRATLGTTLIKRGVKIDNLVQVGHNVVLGEDSILVAQVGISGSVQIGRGVVLGGQVGVAGHLTIGDGTVVGGQSGVTKDIPPHQTVSGLPCVPHEKWLKAQMSFLKLPTIRKGLSALEKRVKRIEERLGIC